MSYIEGEDRWRRKILADTGYYNYLEIIDVVDESTELLIKPQRGKQNNVESGFDKENFEYDAINDSYISRWVMNYLSNGMENKMERVQALHLRSLRYLRTHEDWHQ